MGRECGIASGEYYGYQCDAVGEPHKITREDGSYVELDYDAALRLNYYLEDASDSVAALINSSQMITAEYRYDGFGNNLDPALYDDPTSGAGGDFGYHGAWRDTETGLYHMRARTYDPQTGRFTTPDPATPNPHVPESYEPYSFANNNPHLYSDPTGLFSVTEISVSVNIQSSLQRLKTVVVQQAKQHAKEEIEEFAVDFLVGKLESLLPSFGGIDPRPFLAALGGGQEATIELGKLFEKSLIKTVLDKILPFDGLWIHPTINPDTGEVLNAGLNKNNFDGKGGITTYGTPGPKPDYLINPSNPQDSSPKRTWLIGDITLSANRLVKKYVDPANQLSQWNAIMNHSKNHGFWISVFFTFYEGGSHVEQALRELVGKEAIENGAFVFIISLKD